MMNNFLKLRDKLQETYGDSSVMLVSDIPVRPPLPSASLALDFALGGGLPPDRVVEVAGSEGTGKSSLGLLAMSNFLDLQPNRGAVILDLEHKLTASWVEQLIGKQRMERVILAWPDHMEEATDMYTKAVSTGEVSFVLVDSIGGAPTQRVTEKSAEKGNIGGNALAVTRFAQLASIYSQKYNCLTFGVNQTREDMGGYNRHVTPGGRAWKHACVIRVQLKRGQGKIEEKVNGESMQIGYEVVAKVVKNQLAAPGRTANYWFLNVATDRWGFGIDRLEEVVRLSLLTSVVRQSGAWYYEESLPDGKIKSKDSLSLYVRDNPDYYKHLSDCVMSAVKSSGEMANLVAPIEALAEEE
jgi:recombination protein RecA